MPSSIVAAPLQSGDLGAANLYKIFMGKGYFFSLKFGKISVKIMKNVLILAITPPIKSIKKGDI
jgi:hypothetical protein